MKKNNPLDTVKIEKISRNVTATMHNNFIEARYRLTIEEQRILLALISLIKPEDEDFKDYKISVKAISELIGTRHKNMYKVLDEATDRLMNRLIKIELISEEGKRKFKKFHFISYAEYENGKGYLVIRIDKALKPYLLKLKEKFTKIPLRYLFTFRSTYSIRLYELLKQYEGTGFRIDELVELREMLGVEPNEYKRFEAFERKVLKVAVKEINKKADIEVSYKKKKTGRKITHIEFYIKPKNLNQGVDTNLTKTSSETLDIQGQKQEKFFEAKKDENKGTSVDIWEEIRKLRKSYKSFLEEIKEKTTRLNENQILFLLVNANKQIFPEQFMREIIINADRNKSLNNPMGFLVNTFQIDMNDAKFKELTLTASKIDEELFRKKLEEMFVNGNSALKYIKAYWNDRIKGRVQKNTAVLLREPLRKAVYDDLENKIYIPVPDEIYKDWFKTNFLEDIKGYLNEKFGVEEVFIEVVS